MKHDGDERGYPREAYTKIDQFILEFKRNPEKFKDFRDKIYYSEELKNQSEISYPTDEETFRRVVELYLFETMEVELGTAITWNEYRVVERCRRYNGDCIAWFSHPSLDEIRDNVNEAAIIAATITTLTAIWTNPAIALPIFKEVFYACLVSKNVKWAKEIGIGFRKKSRCLD